MYNKRGWLNGNKSASTGSVVCYHGKSPYCKAKSKDKIAFLEVSDCHQSARLHQSVNETRKQFTDKVKLLRDSLNDFIEYLEK